MVSFCWLTDRSCPPCACVHVPEGGSLSMLAAYALPAQRVPPEVLFQRLSELKGTVRHLGWGWYLVFAFDSFVTLGGGSTPLLASPPVN